MTSFTFTLVKLTLTSGTIWTKATHLDTDSEFEIYTTDSTAAVRGTIFVVSTNGNTTDTLVIEGEVDVSTNTDIRIIKKLKDGESIVTDNGREIGISKIDPNTTPVFLVNNSIRDEETERNIALNEDETEVSEISPTCTPSEIQNSITGIKTIITCDAFGNSIEDKSCINNTKGFNADKTECININCVDVDGEQVCEEIDGLNLFAYAPYEVKGHLEMYGDNGIIKKADGGNIFEQAQITNNTYDLTSYCDNITTTPSLNNTYSFCKSGLTEGIFIDSTGTNEFLKYSTLDLDSDFIIKMNVRVPNTSGITHYLLHAGDNFKLYIYNGYLYYKKGTNTSILSTFLEFNIGEFNTIAIKKEENSSEENIIYLKVNNGAWIDTNMTFDDDIENLYVGAAKLGSSYVNQINDIIDYIKIYK